MSLTQEDALKRAGDMLKSTNAQRAYMESYCGLMLCYAYGDQWAKIGPTRAGTGFQQIRQVLDPTRSDIRVSMNMIRARVQKLDSRLKPQTINATAKPASRAANDQIAAMVADGLVPIVLERADALSRLRHASLWRLVLGSVMIARTMTPGPRVILRNATGDPVVGEDGQPVTLPTYCREWGICPPYEFIRDSSATSVYLEGEDTIGRERPMSVDWLKRSFPNAVPKDFESKATMGQLLEFQKFIYQATEVSADYGWSQSQRPAVMVSEYYFRDDEEDAQQRWPWYMLAYRDTASREIDDRGLKVLYFGPNPFYQLPYHHFWYEEELLKPWGRGVPAQLIHSQNAVNIAFTTMFQTLVTHSGCKYIVEHNSLVDTPNDALSNDQRKPIYYRKGATKPDRLLPPPLDPNCSQILGQAPQWMDWMLNMAPVQSGQAVARGEAAHAYEIRRDQADTVINAINDTDEMELNKLLTGTVFDAIKSETVESLQQQLSGEFTAEQIQALKAQDVQATLTGIMVVPDTLRPRTPDQQAQDFAMAINTKMVEPQNARRTMLVKGGLVLDEKERRAYQLQGMEIQQILSGVVVDVALSHDHATHRWRIELETESPRWSSGYTPQQREALMQHYNAHKEAMDFLAAPQILPGQPGQPQQPNSPQPGVGSGQQPAESPAMATA